MLACSYKIFIESQESRSDAAKAAHEGIVPAIVDLIERNHFSNSFDYFQALIEEMNNWSLMITQ